MRTSRSYFQLALSLAILIATSLSAAEVDTSEPNIEAPKRFVPRSVEKQEFTGLTLKGQLKKPDLSYIYKRQGLRAEQIVNIPENFNDEIIEGAGEF
jgi:hypothetical protein